MNKLCLKKFIQHREQQRLLNTLHNKQKTILRVNSRYPHLRSCTKDELVIYTVLKNVSINAALVLSQWEVNRVIIHSLNYDGLQRIFG